MKKITSISFSAILIMSGIVFLALPQSVKASSTLGNLTISEGVLNPQFNTSTLNYSAIVPYSAESIDVTPTATDTGTIQVNGTPVTSGSSININLNMGSNTITIEVTDGDTTTYTLNITREDKSAVFQTYTGIGSAPYMIVFDGTNMWTANAVSNNVSKIAPSGEITNYTVGPAPLGIAYDGNGNMWITDSNAFSGDGGGAIAKINVSTSELNVYVDTELLDVPVGIAFDGTDMWVANGENTSIVKISPDGDMTEYIDITTNSAMRLLAFDGEDMWTANSDDNSVTKIDLSTCSGSTCTTTTYSGIGSGPIGIAFDGEDMWTANSNDNSVTKVDLSTCDNTTCDMTTYPGTGSGPINIAFDGPNQLQGITEGPSQNMWTTNSDGTITKINISTGDMITYDKTGGVGYGIAFDGNNIWTSNTTIIGGGSYGNSVTRTVMAEIDSDASLTNLSADISALSPAFDTDTYSYTLPDTEKSTIEITPTSGNEYASITVNGRNINSGNPIETALTFGINTINIVVTATDGSTTLNYQITIEKTLEDANMTVLHEIVAEGSTPGINPIIFDGRLYGANYEGGLISLGQGDGTIYSMNIDGSDFKLLHSFTNDGDEGAQPTSLVEYGGVLYGVTVEGGDGSGIIFSINPDGTDYSILHSFDYWNDGDGPRGALIIENGIIYGTTHMGGSGNYGTIFSLKTDGSDFNVLHNFSGGIDDGNRPVAALILNNKLYGTTIAGGIDDGINGYGTIFSINTDGTDFTLMHRFDGSLTNDGAYPFGSLVLSDDGTKFYGVAEEGGSSNLGIIFSIDVASPYDFNVLYSFTGSENDGAYPLSSVILHENILYGTTAGDTWDNISAGNPPAYTGTVFSFDLSSNELGFIHSFSGSPDDGLYPSLGSLAISEDTLYGSTLAGGTGDNNTGTVYSVGIDGSNYTLIHPVFVYSIENGVFPTVGLIPSEDGQTFYGTTGLGGLGGGGGLAGTIFSIKNDGSDFKLLHSFDQENEGLFPLGSLLLYNGKLYGGTVVSGPGGGSGALGDGGGVLFSINEDGSDFTVLHAFADDAVPSDGMCPFSQLFPYNGKLYGTTERGGTNDKGTLFSMNPDGSDFAILYNFQGGTNGAFPYGYLTLSESEGKFYGMTNGNSFYSYLMNIFNQTPFPTDDSGVIYSVNLDGTGYEVLHLFEGDTGNQPLASSLNLVNNTLYGLTYLGGESNLGTIFSLGTDGSNYNILHSFTGGVNGSYPWSSMTYHNGKFYGIASGNVFNSLIGILFGQYIMAGSAVVFSIDPDGSDFKIEYDFQAQAPGTYTFAPGNLTMVGSTFYGMTSATTTDSSIKNLGTIFSLQLFPSHNTDIYSLIYTITNEGDGTGAIANIPAGTTKADFLSNIYGASDYQEWDDSNISDPLADGDTLIVTAEDGTTVAIYTIVMGGSTSTISLNDINDIDEDSLKLELTVDPAHANQELDFRIKIRNEDKDETDYQTITQTTDADGKVTLSIDDLDSNTDYELSVQYSEHEADTFSDYSNSKSATTDDAVDGDECVPSKLSATAISSSQINITWNDNCDTEEGFYLERKTDGGSYEKIGELGKNDESFSDTNLTPNTTYTYRIRAYEGDDESDYSDTVSATTLRTTTAYIAPTVVPPATTTPTTTTSPTTTKTTTPVVTKTQPTAPAEKESKLEQFFADKNVQIVATIAEVIGLLAGLATAAAAAAVPLFPLSPAPLTEAVSKFSTLFGLFGPTSRKRKDSGIVFDEETRLPIEGVNVSIVDQFGRIVDSTVTDERGRYGFLAKDGIYTIQISKKGYDLKTSESEDEYYGHLYNGKPFQIRQNDMIKINIAMKALNVNWKNFAERKIASYTSVFSIIRKDAFLILFYVGFAAAVSMLYFFPSTVNATIAAVYGVIAIYRIFFKTKSFGIISNKFNKPVPFSMVSLYALEDPARRVAFTATDVLGRYYLLVKDGYYNMKVQGQELNGESFIKTMRVYAKRGIIKEDVRV